MPRVTTFDFGSGGRIIVVIIFRVELDLVFSHSGNGSASKRKNRNNQKQKTASICGQKFLRGPFRFLPRQDSRDKRQSISDLRTLYFYALSMHDFINSEDYFLPLRNYETKSTGHGEW